jgi:hypothetical protein
VQRDVPPARYEYNWNSLVGCLQGLLRAAGLPHDAARISAVSGEAFRLPPVASAGAGPAFASGADHPRDLSALAGDLALLGLRARVDVWDLRSGRPPLLGRRLGWRLRRALADGRAAAVSGVAGGDFGLLVGYDGERRAYRVDGPLSAEIGGWLRADRLPAPDAVWLAAVLPEGATADGAADMATLVRRAAAHQRDAGRADRLRDWVALLRSDVEIGASGHARAAQTLAAAAGEAARFFRQAAAEGIAEAAPLAEPAAAMAVSLSRFATLFPFPGGGDVVGGGREAGARSLESALRAEADPAAPNPPGATDG